MPLPTIIQEVTQALDPAQEEHSISFTAPPTEGNWAFLFIHVRGAIFDANVQVVTPAAGAVQIAVGEQDGVAKLWRYKITAALEQTFVIDHNIFGTDLAGSFGVLVEVSDTVADDPIDDVVVDEQGGASTSLAVGDVITTIADDLLLVFVGVRQGGDNDSFSATNGFVVGNARDAHSGAAAQPSGGGWGVRPVMVIDTYNTTMSWTTGGSTIGILVAISESPQPPPPIDTSLPKYGQGRAAIGDPPVYGATIVRS